ncbi:MAG: insulinase family protein [Flavobacteriales bacterium]|nr:insulinase family protein [Flavobacteriales bacterium]
MKKFGMLLSAGLFSIQILCAQAVKINFVEYDLPNGLHVILHEDHTVPLVAVTVNYHVGSKNENPERTGFAHFFEHLLFEGSENIKRGEFFKYVSSAGGQNNAYTTQDQTFYYEVLPSNQLELGLWLESERMLHAKIEEVGVETQREVVKEEKRLRVDNQPYGRFISEIFVRAFKSHPYRWAPIGSMDHLNAAQLSEFIDFYKTFYVPNNAVLSIAGDIDIEKTKVLVDKYFKDIPKGTREIPRPKKDEPPLNKEVRDTVYDEFIQLPAVVYAYRIPSMKSEDQYALQMMSQVLSGGSSSRMNKELVDNKQKALQAFAFNYALEDHGLFITAAIAGMNVDAKELDQLMDIEVEKMKKELITEKEFEKIRNQMENQVVSQNSGVQGVATNLSNNYLFFKNTNLINTELEKYMKVTREDIQRMANTYLKKENRVVMYYLPGKK